jgi:hypothetical protein
MKKLIETRQILGYDVKAYIVSDLRFHSSEGICLFWINEIHIDSKYLSKSESELKKVLDHEYKHYYYIRNAINRKGLSRLYWFVKNDLWSAKEQLIYIIKLLKRLVKFIKDCV